MAERDVVLRSLGFFTALSCKFHTGVSGVERVRRREHVRVRHELAGVSAESFL